MVHSQSGDLFVYGLQGHTYTRMNEREDCRMSPFAQHGNHLRTRVAQFFASQSREVPKANGVTQLGLAPIFDVTPVSITGPKTRDISCAEHPIRIASFI